MKPEQKKTYQTISNALHYLVSHQAEQPSLDALATHLALSPSHVQKLFSAWVGVSPKQYLQFLTKEHAKTQLKQHSVIEASFNVGLSGSGRLHDLLIKTEGMSPGEYKSKGQALTIDYGFFESPFGPYLLAVTTRGICKLAFYDSINAQKQLIKELEADWPLSEIYQDQNAPREFATKLFSEKPLPSKQTLTALLKGSPFQIQVWEALLSIPPGAIIAYQGLADTIGQPNSVRAVASALAKNTIAYLIPCHRVIRSCGTFNQYRWGSTRKKLLIAWESARISQSE